MADKREPVYLRIMATPQEAHVLRSYFDPRLGPPKVVQIDHVPGTEYEPEGEVAVQVGVAGIAPPVETQVYDLRKVWVQKGLLLLNEREAAVVLDALGEAEWSCTQMRRRHESAARQFHYAGYEKSADAREGCAEDNGKRAGKFDELFRRLKARLDGEG